MVRMAPLVTRRRRLRCPAFTHEEKKCDHENVIIKLQNLHSMSALKAIYGKSLEPSLDLWLSLNISLYHPCALLLLPILKSYYFYTLLSCIILT